MTDTSSSSTLPTKTWDALAEFRSTSGHQYSRSFVRTPATPPSEEEARERLAALLAEHRADTAPTKGPVVAGTAATPDPLELITAYHVTFNPPTNLMDIGLVLHSTARTRYGHLDQTTLDVLSTHLGQALNADPAGETVTWPYSAGERVPVTLVMTAFSGAYAPPGVAVPLTEQTLALFARLRTLLTTLPESVEELVINPSAVPVYITGIRTSGVRPGMPRELNQEDQDLLGTGLGMFDLLLSRAGLHGWGDTSDEVDAGSSFGLAPVPWNLIDTYLPGWYTDAPVPVAG